MRRKCFQQAILQPDKALTNHVEHCDRRCKVGLVCAGWAGSNYETTRLLANRIGFEISSN